MKITIVYVSALIVTFLLVRSYCVEVNYQRRNKADIVRALDLSEDYMSKDIEYLRALLYER